MCTRHTKSNSTNDLTIKSVRVHFVFVPSLPQNLVAAEKKRKELNQAYAWEHASYLTNKRGSIGIVGLLCDQVDPIFCDPSSGNDALTLSGAPLHFQTG